MPGAQYVINLWVSVLCPGHHDRATGTTDHADPK